MSSYCCHYTNCMNLHSPGSFLSFFKVPDDCRRSIWLKHSGKPYLQIGTNVSKKIYFCEMHFYEGDIIAYSDRKVLKNTAIPKAFDPLICSSSEKKMDELCNKILLSGAANSIKRTETRKRKRMTKSFDITETESHEALRESDSEELIVKRGPHDKTYSRRCNIPLLPETNEICQSQFPSPPRNSNQKINSNQEDFKLSKVPYYVYHSPKIKKSEKPKDILSSLNHLLENKSEEVKTFVRSQLFHIEKSHWSENEKQLALQFFYKSPALYKEMIRLGFALPSVSSILKWHSLIRFNTGLSEAIIHMLTKKIIDISNENRGCILLFDEMSTKTELEYNLKDDMIFGFQDLGPIGRTNEFASSILLLMIRGINANWKQCIGYVAGHVNGVGMSTIVKDTITILTKIGFEVLGITCEQGCNNRLCLNLNRFMKSGPSF